MNYYIQGDAAKADRIKAAFEKKGVRLPIRPRILVDGLIKAAKAKCETKNA